MTISTKSKPYFLSFQLRDSCTTAIKHRLCYEDNILKEFWIFDPTRWQGKEKGFAMGPLTKICSHFKPTLPPLKNLAQEWDQATSKIQVWDW